MHEALYQQQLEDGKVECLLCPQDCHIPEGATGLCRGRGVHDGTLMAESYSRVTAVNLDPIEKKPLYHFYPGTMILSAGTYGCNLRCLHCQNCDISQQVPPVVKYREVTPEDLVEAAGQNGSIGIAYTYNEPLIWYEYILDCAKLARDAGMVNVLVTNGYINPAPLEELLPWIDAANVDVKAFSEDFYQKVGGGHLQPVLDNVETIASSGTHLETTTLLIPGYNDDPEELEQLALWLAEATGGDTPVHLSAYTPRHKLNAPATTLEGLQEACDIFSTRLEHVYLGNVVSDKGADTSCSKCGEVLVRRTGYTVSKINLDDTGKCRKCGAANHFTMAVKPPAGTSDN